MKEQWQTIRRVLQYYPRVFGLVWNANPRHAGFIIFLSIVNALAIPTQIWLVKVVIDEVIFFIQGAGIEWTPIVMPAVALAAVLTAGDLSRSLEQALREVLSLEVELRVKTLILDKAATLDIAFFETPSFYDQLQNAQRDLWRVRNLPYLLVDTTRQAIAVFGTLALLARLHPLAIVVVLATALPQLIAQARHGNLLFKLWTGRAPAERMVNYLSDLLAERDAVKEVRLFGLQPLFLARFQDYGRQFADEIRKLVFSYERTNSLAVLLSVAGMTAIWAYAILQAAFSRITVGDLALVFQAATQVRNGLGILFRTLGMFYEHSLFMGNLYGFLELSPDAIEGALARPQPETGQHFVPRPIHQGIEFRHVSFRYPGADRYVLRDLSFAIRPQSAVAIVGENGAGKTTLIKLLTRLYDPTEGVILLDGCDLRTYDLADLRSQIGVIFQDFVRYNLTAGENIGLGQLEYMDDLKRVAQAADRGGAAPVIGKLADGYATILGRTFENSVDLSGGEWQKLALGRAFMRDSQVLILDEPTAALDALAEYEVYRRFAELTAGRTTIFISHRFSTVRMAQQILVLADGHLIESGNHAELMAHNGRYAEMFKVQAERYQ
jgi:ATP-binding cassette subfamily B protein